MEFADSIVVRTVLRLLAYSGLGSLFFFVLFVPHPTSVSHEWTATSIFVMSVFAAFDILSTARDELRDGRLRAHVAQQIVSFKRAWYKRPAETTASLRSRQKKFRESQKDDEQLFLPSVWLEMSKVIHEVSITEPTELDDKDWLSEFTKSGQTDSASDFIPSKFSKSQEEFKVAPDRIILRLEQHNRDVRIRDLSNEMIAFTSLPASRADAFEHLLERIANVLETTKVSATGASPSMRYRPSGQLRNALASLEHVRVAEGQDTEGQDVVGADTQSTTRQAVRAFLRRSIRMADRQEGLIERTWQIERHRRVVEILESTDSLACPHDEVGYMLDELQRLHISTQPITAVHEYFQLATVAFAEIVTDSRADNFNDAVQKLREFAKHHNQHYKYLYDEILRLQTEIALHRQAVVCLEYRHVLESLPQRDIINRVAPGSVGKDSTSQWKFTWEEAVKVQLTAMLEARLDEMNVAAGRSVPSLITKPSDPHLTKLFQFDFGYWARQKPAGSNHTNLVVMFQAKPQRVNLTMVNYSAWGSYQLGLHFYGSLSTSIHSYSKHYAVEEGTWLQNSKHVLDWLRPTTMATANDTATEPDWAQEWSNRNLPP